MFLFLIEFFISPTFVFGLLCFYENLHQVLKNGVEVKLQRNALSVLEPPTGNEDDDDYDFDDSSSGSDIGEKDHHPFY